MSYIVKAYTPWSRGGERDNPTRIVILRWEHRPAEWSTHVQERTGGDFPTLYWGHYFKTYEEALVDAEARVRLNNTGMTPEHENYISHLFPAKE